MVGLPRTFDESIAGDFRGAFGMEVHARNIFLDDAVPAIAHDVEL